MSLKSQLVELFKQQKGREFTLAHLFELLHPKNNLELVFALGELVRNGAARQVFRVCSPSMHGGIKDFERAEDVPDEIHDWRVDVTIPVTVEDVLPVYIARA